MPWTQPDNDHIKKMPLIDVAAKLISSNDWSGLRTLCENNNRPHSKNLVAVAELFDKELPQDIVILHPHNLGGRLTHYYHFACAVLFPLLIEIEIGSVRSGASIVCPDCGPMNRHLHFVFAKFRLKAVFYHPLLTWSMCNIPECRHLHLTPYDRSNVSGFEMSREMNDLLQGCGHKISGITGQQSRIPILLIDRGPPSDFYVRENQGQIDGSAGSARRSIPNIERLDVSLNKVEETTSVRLETLTLAEQIALFRNSDVIVAQHGAALVNLAWSTSSTAVVEIVPTSIKSRDINHFRNMCRSRGIQHIHIVQGGRDTPVDVVTVTEHVRAILARNRSNNLNSYSRGSWFRSVVERGLGNEKNKF